MSSSGHVTDQVTGATSAICRLRFCGRTKSTCLEHELDVCLRSRNVICVCGVQKQRELGGLRHSRSDGSFERGARWVPKMLTPFDKQRRLQTSKDFLELVGDNIDEICDRIVTVDETWVRQYDPNLNRSPCNGRKRRKAAKEIQGTRGSRTEATWEVIDGMLFLQDNASVHTARVSRQALKDTGFSEIDHPPYSPDLAPSDYFLFSNLKKELRGRRFVDDNQMKMAVESQRKGIFFGRFEGVIHQMRQMYFA
ncbi:Histone-lysine N-methyltransferase SETMAR [Eumeta japonica]|uniref:Histone-lysine N-methyltransferase SETMAR n=1 Tax=Eumeta variegata TaxID=151549 RepID=A0A4C1YPP4_EUMVA|nr:Histone-lysine N-methyltransferase SETMAR [Eumeta japonica]